MTHYNLKKGIYLIKGAKKHCIYNSNNGFVYHINSDTLDFLETINDKGNIDKSQIEETKLLKTFESADIIELAVKRTIFADIKTELQNKNKIEFAWIEVTKKCNLYCLHCYEESHPAINGELSDGDFQILIPQLIKYGIKRIQFIGGEPFLLGDKLKKMIEYCSDKFESIEIFTNGTLINEKWVKFLKSKNVGIALSIYSYNKEQHDKVTKVKGSFEKTNKTITLLTQYNIHYRVCGVEMKGVEMGDNTSDLYKLQKLDLVRLTGRANLSLYNESMLKRKIITENNFRRNNKIQDICKMVSGHNCFSKNLYIDCNLEVFPCVMERRFVHGNLKNQELATLINDNIKLLTKDYIDGCSQCEYKYFCSDCRPDSLGAEKYAKPWYCSYKPETGEWIDSDIYIKSLKSKYYEKL